MHERSLILLKPDCVERLLIGEVIRRFENKGLDVVAMKMMQMTQEIARKHYVEHVEKDWYPQLEEFIMQGPVVAMVLQGPEVIEVVRKLVGATNGRQADIGTIRGDYSQSRQKNLVHASDSLASAEREVAVFFEEHEFCAPRKATDYTMRANDETNV